MWPAGALDEYFIIAPVLQRTGQINGILGGWSGGRKYPVDFAQFAVNLKLLRNVRA